MTSEEKIIRRSFVYGSVFGILCATGTNYLLKDNKSNKSSREFDKRENFEEDDPFSDLPVRWSSLCLPIENYVGEENSWTNICYAKMKNGKPLPCYNVGGWYTFGAPFGIAKHLYEHRGDIEKIPYCVGGLKNDKHRIVIVNNSSDKEWNHFFRFSYFEMPFEGEHSRVLRVQSPDGCRSVSYVDMKKDGIINRIELDKLEGFGIERKVINLDMPEYTLSQWNIARDPEIILDNRRLDLGLRRNWIKKKS